MWMSGSEDRLFSFCTGRNIPVNKKGGLFGNKYSWELVLQVGIAAAVLLIPAAVEAATGIDVGKKRKTVH